MDDDNARDSITGSPLNKAGNAVDSDDLSQDCPTATASGAPGDAADLEVGPRPSGTGGQMRPFGSSPPSANIATCTLWNVRWRE